MAEQIDWDSGVITPPPEQADAIDWDSGEIAPPPKRTFGSDARNALMQGVQQLPGAATGLADIAAGALGHDRPFSRAADRLGQVTGFQPSQWAKERDALYSDETLAARAEIDQAWNDPSTNALDVASSYARNPRASALQILRSVPSMAAGAAVARGAGVVLPALSAVARAALGEGAVMAGQQMDQIDPTVDPQRAAAAAATTGVVGGTIGAAGGKIAARLGVRDIDTTLAGGAVNQAAQQAPGLARRVATGAVQEGLIEEGSQSAVETAAQNWAERKPLTEGMARNVTEGAIAGGIMGGGVAALPRGQSAQALQVNAQDAQADPSLPPDGIPDGPAPAARPSETMGIDPAAGPMSRAAAESVDSQPDRLTPEEVRAFNNAYRRDVPDPLGKLQQQVQTDTAYTSPDEVAKVRGEIEDAWLQSNVASDTGVAPQDGQAAPAAAATFGDPIAQADARLRDRRIMSAVQNVVDGAASNGVAAFGYLDGALDRIGEAPLSLAERARVRRVLDSTAGFTGRTERAPLPTDPVPQGDMFAQNDAMEALIPERRADAVQPAGAGQQQAATPAPSASFSTYEDAEAYIAEQRRAGGTRMQALPLPRADGSVGLALRGTPDFQAAQFAQRARQQRAAGVLDGDVLSKSGEIFSLKQRGQARMVAARLGPGYAVASVQGGFVARKVAEPNPAPDAVPAQAVQTTRSAAAGGGTVDQDGRANTVAAQLTPPAAVEAPAQAEPVRPGLARMQAARAARNAADQQQTPQRLAGARIDREWTAFAPESGSKGIPRAEMPQIRSAHRGAMVQFLKGRGIGHAQETVAPGTLKPTQAEFSPRKVARAGGFKGGDRSILVSADGHVLDGHHQWMAKLQAGQPVDVIRLDAPIEQLIDEMRQFPSAATAAGAQPAQQDPGAGQTADAGAAPGAAQALNPAQVVDSEQTEPAAAAGQTAAPAPAPASSPTPVLQQPAQAATGAQTNTSEPGVQQAPAPTAPAAAPAAPASARAAASPAIQDFGEKLHGARKDYAAQLRDAQDVDVAAEPLSKSWPEPDYQKLLAGGTDARVVALIRAARDEVPTKPQKSWRLAGWVEQTKTLRQVADDALSGRTPSSGASLVPPGLTGRAYQDAYGWAMAVRGRAELYEAVGHARSLKGVTFAEHHYSLYRGEANVRKWTVEQKAKATAFSNWPRELAVGDTREQALEQFKDKLGTLDLGAKAKGQTQFDIYRRRSSTDYIIGKKIGREQIDLKRFPDVAAARAFLRDSPAELETLLARYKETPLERRPENQPRVGDDHRSGAPVTPQAFAENFGFRGVQFGNYVEQGRRQSDLNEAFDALMDLAAVLGIPPRALSLNGRLGLAFGARGRGGKGAPGAHYEPDTVVINLTKGGGPGALAHEWWHSLDNYFGREGGGTGFVTDGARADALRAEMQAAFQQVRQATQVKSLRERSRELDRRRSKPYWNTPLELSARAFESYVIAKLQDQNAANDYLANIVGQEAWDVMDAARGRVLEQAQPPTYPYPTTAELPAVREAFDSFFRTVETRETDTGTALFSRSAMKSVEANIQRGRAAMNQVLLERADVHRAMHRSDLGWIDFIWGDDKKGVQHILARRMAQDGMSRSQAERLLTEDLVEAVAQGETIRRTDVRNASRLVIAHGRVEAVLTRNNSTNGWLLSGYEVRRKAGDTAAGDGAGSATLTTPTRSRGSEGAASGAILPAGLSRAQVQAAADSVARQWSKGPEVVVAANMQDPVLPARIRDTDAGQRARGADGTPQGVYLGGKVYLIADQLRSERDVATTLFHEVLGHHGLRAVFGDALQPILSQLATMRRADVEAKAAAYGLDLSKPEQRLQAAEEVLAEMAQTRPQIGWVQRAVAAVRTWLRANVPGMGGLRLTDAEIVRSFLAPARGFVERGGRADRSAGQMPAERVDPVFSRAAAAGQVITDLKRRTGNTLADYRHLALSALGRRQLVELYGKELPQMQAYSDMVQQMDADKNDAGAGADRIATDWGKLPDEQQLADLMHDATLEQIDPAKPFVPGDNQTTYLALKRRHDALTPDARKVYADARDTYRRHHEAVRTALRERIERSALRGPRKAELLQQMDSDFFKAIKGVYFPLARFGQYVVVVRGADGKAVNVSRAETLNEAEAMRHTLRRAYPGATVGKVLKAKEFNAGRDAVGRGFMEELYKALGTREMDDKQRGELEDMLGQLYLSALPDLSWAKHGIHRKGTQGFSQDARRAFAQNVFHGARYLAKVRYSDLLDAELADMQKHVDGQAGNSAYDSVQAQQVLDEMVKRHDAMMNPDASALSTALTSLGFVFHLGLSPASAAVNLTQTAFVALPIMGAKWGFAKASAALLKASKQTAANGNDITSSLTAQEREAYDEAVRSGVIDVTMAHDLAGISQGEDAKVSWKLRPVMRWASFLFHHAEKFNRQVTFVAAYRLAREAGTEHKQAYGEAVKATYDGHFDYSACVDDATEILTSSGWRRRADLRVGDVAIATDKDGRAVESKVLAVNVYQGQHEVIEFTSSNHFSMVLTPNHDCVVQNYNSRDKKWQAIRKVQAGELRQHHHLLRTPLAPLERAGGSLGEDFATLLGWIASEGWYAKYRGCTAKHDVRLAQSLSHNPAYVAEIRAVLDRLGGDYKEYFSEKRQMVFWVLRRALGQRVQEHLPDKVLTPALVQRLSTSEMRALLDAFMKGNGSCDATGRSWTIAHKDGSNLDQLQAMATMCGMRATVRPVNAQGIATLYLVPGDTGCRSHVRPLQQVRRTEPLVWCPTTEHGTWIARRAGGVFVTGNSNRPRVMQGNVARVVLLFKQYSQNMIYTLSRQAFLAVRGEKPADRAEARKALGGLLAMHAAGAGILGLPLVTTLLAAASAIGGSDDEPWDAEVALRNMLADALGQKPAEVLARGLSRLTPSDISGRVGLDKLILPDIQEGLEGQRLGESAMAAALGPVAGIGISLLKGLQEMADGNWVRGLETMAPSAVRGPMKALRYADEGVVDRNGKAVLADVSGLGILGQAMGFSPSDVRLAYEGKSAIYQADQRLVRRRAELIRQFSMAKVMGDEEAAQEAQGDIQGFNTTNPERRITAMNLAASMRMRRRQIEEAEQGVYLPRARREAVDEGRFAVEEE